MTSIKSIFSSIADKESYEITDLRCYIVTLRTSKNKMFLECTDGSHSEMLHVFIDDEDTIKYLTDNLIKVGYYISVTGKMVYTPDRKQKYEVIPSGDGIKIISKIEGSSTEIAQRQLPFTVYKQHDDVSIIRDKLDIRCKHPIYATIFRIRSALYLYIAEFFTSKGVLRIDPNIITSSDCEGAGEMFMIQQGTKKVKIDSSKEIEVPEFFGVPAGLTVSSQLELEILVRQFLTGVWTMNPSFRAEKSQTRRHLAQFTHLEWELMFKDLSELMDFSEDLTKFLIKKIHSDHKSDLELLQSYGEKGIIEKLQKFSSDDKWPRITYTMATIIIKKHKDDLLEYFKDDSLLEKGFVFPEWGDDLGSYCERFISEVIYGTPVFITDYPATLKSFYMLQNDDKKTVSCCDLLVPYLGELIGSSMRENSYEKLYQAIQDKKIDITSIQWYLDMRKYEPLLTGGAGLGFERLCTVLTTGYKSGEIRDVCAFPVAYGDHLKY